MRVLSPRTRAARLFFAVVSVILTSTLSFSARADPWEPFRAEGFGQRLWQDLPDPSSASSPRLHEVVAQNCQLLATEGGEPVVLAAIDLRRLLFGVRAGLALLERGEGGPLIHEQLMTLAWVGYSALAGDASADFAASLSRERGGQSRTEPPEWLSLLEAHQQTTAKGFAQAFEAHRDRVLEATPNRTSALALSARMSLEQNRPQEALEWLDRARSTDAQIALLRARALALLEKSSEGSERLAKSVRRARETLPPHDNRVDRWDPLAGRPMPSEPPSLGSDSPRPWDTFVDSVAQATRSASQSTLLDRKAAATRLTAAVQEGVAQWGESNQWWGSTSGALVVEALLHAAALEGGDPDAASALREVAERILASPELPSNVYRASQTWLAKAGAIERAAESAERWAGSNGSDESKIWAAGLGLASAVQRGEPNLDRQKLALDASSAGPWTTALQLQLGWLAALSRGEMGLQPAREQTESWLAQWRQHQGEPWATTLRQAALLFLSYEAMNRPGAGETAREWSDEARTFEPAHPGASYQEGVLALAETALDAAAGHLQRVLRAAEAPEQSLLAHLALARLAQQDRDLAALMLHVSAALELWPDASPGARAEQWREVIPLLHASVSLRAGASGPEIEPYFMPIFEVWVSIRGLDQAALARIKDKLSERLRPIESTE